MRWESWLARLALAGLAVFQLLSGNQSGGLVAAQGGRVWLEDAADGAGARFVFSLPAAAAGDEASG